MRIHAGLAFVAALALPSAALAGGCPTCTTDLECVPPGGGAGFCVEWSRDFGCGSQRIACCPGQGCSTFDGRPSCEGADSDGDGVDDCQVLGAAVDAGTPAADAGPGDVDAGTPVGDAGTPVGDAGTPVGDAGTPSGDAGSAAVDAGSGSLSDGGCGCRTTGGSSGAPGALVLLALVGLARRRAR